MTLSFEFIDFLFTNSSTVHLYEFFKTCEIPEEHYYATLYRIPNVPGGYNPDIKERYFNIDNYFWRTNYFGKEDSRRCSGRTVHNICIVDVGDLTGPLKKVGDLYFTTSTSWSMITSSWTVWRKRSEPRISWSIFFFSRLIVSHSVGGTLRAPIIDAAFSLARRATISWLLWRGSSLPQRLMTYFHLSCSSCISLSFIRSEYICI